MTFSIIGFDPDEKMIGSAVASKWTGVGGCVQFFKPGVGLVNFQNHSYAQVAHRILDGMEEGVPLAEAVEMALSTDDAREHRQCNLADLNGNFYVYSGKNCTNLHYQKIGKNCAAAGNTLVSANVVENMIQAFEKGHDHSFVERLIAALEAGQEAGGDSRGQEAASVKAYKLTYPIQRFYPVDLRVDSEDEPLKKLRFLYETFSKGDRRYMRS